MRSQLKTVKLKAIKLKKRKKTGSVNGEIDKTFL